MVFLLRVFIASGGLLLGEMVQNGESNFTGKFRGKKHTACRLHTNVCRGQLNGNVVSI